MQTLDGQVALITGAGRGVGRALALKLARSGARLVLNDLDAEPLHETADEIAHIGTRAVLYPGSVTDDDFPARFIVAAAETFGDIGIIVNNAGFTIDRAIGKSTDAEWDLVHAVNLRAPYRILREAASFLHEAARKERTEGREIIRKVVNVSSMAGTRGSAGQSVYSAAKAGLIGLTRSLAKEWGRYRINVNCVAFGAIDTRQTHPKEDGATVSIGRATIAIGSPAEGLADLVRSIPLGRVGTPQEAANAIYLLCSPESNYISGQVVEAGGGLSA
jgi:3-oxoacyl-[acyl-carrier protein] reductase